LQDELGREKINSSRLSVRLEAESTEKEKAAKAAEEERFEVAKLKAQLAALQKDLESEALHAKGADRVAQRLEREKSAAEKKASLEQSRLIEVKELAEEKSAELTALEGENRRLLMEATKMRTVISVLERDREKMRQQVRRTWGRGLSAAAVCLV
jgi:chromosome segregation ATPase